MSLYAQLNDATRDVGALGNFGAKLGRVAQQLGRAAGQVTTADDEYRRVDANGTAQGDQAQLRAMRAREALQRAQEQRGEQPYVSYDPVPGAGRVSSPPPLPYSGSSSRSYTSVPSSRQYAAQANAAMQQQVQLYEAIGARVIEAQQHAPGSDARQAALNEAIAIADKLPRDADGKIAEPISRGESLIITSGHNGKSLRYKINRSDNFASSEELVASMGRVAEAQMNPPYPVRREDLGLKPLPETAAGQAQGPGGKVPVNPHVAGEDQKLVDGIVASIAEVQLAKSNPAAINAVASQVPAAAEKDAKLYDGVKLHKIGPVTVKGKGGIDVEIKGGIYTPAQITQLVMDAMGAEPEVVAAVNKRMGAAAPAVPAPTPGMKPVSTGAEPPPTPAPALHTGAPAPTPAPVEKVAELAILKGGTERVGKVQQTLEGLGFATDAGGIGDGKVDGIAGDMTKKAVRKVEEILKKHGKIDKVDGIIDDAFIAALEAAKNDPALKAELEAASGKKMAAGGQQASAPAAGQIVAGMQSGSTVSVPVAAVILPAATAPAAEVAVTEQAAEALVPQSIAGPKVTSAHVVTVGINPEYSDQIRAAEVAITSQPQTERVAVVETPAAAPADPVVLAGPTAVQLSAQQDRAAILGAFGALDFAPQPAPAQTFVAPQVIALAPPPVEFSLGDLPAPTFAGTQPVSPQGRSA